LRISPYLDNSEFCRAGLRPGQKTPVAGLVPAIHALERP
jgi:hypothetical protein